MNGIKEKPNGNKNNSRWYEFALPLGIGCVCMILFSAHFSFFNFICMFYVHSFRLPLFGAVFLHSGSTFIRFIASFGVLLFCTAVQMRVISIKAIGSHSSGALHTICLALFSSDSMRPSNFLFAHIFCCRRALVHLIQDPMTICNFFWLGSVLFLFLLLSGYVGRIQTEKQQTLPMTTDERSTREKKISEKSTELIWLPFVWPIVLNAFEKSFGKWPNNGFGP